MLPAPAASQLAPLLEQFPSYSLSQPDRTLVPSQSPTNVSIEQAELGTEKLYWYKDR